MDVVSNDRLCLAVLNHLLGLTVLVFDEDLRFQLAAGPGLTEELLYQRVKPGQTLHEAMPPAYAASFETAFRAALVGETRTQEFLYGGGTYEIQVCPLSFGDPPGTAGMAVSRRLDQSADLPIALHRHQILIEQTNDAVFLLDLHGNPLEWNRRAVEMLGYAYEDFNHMSIADVTPPDEYEHTARRLNQLITEGYLPVYERRFVRKDRQEIIAEVNLTLVHDQHNRPACIQCVVRDISDRKQAEAALKASEERYRILTELIADYAYSFGVTEDGGLVAEWVAGATLRTTGYTADELLSNQTSLIHPQDNDQVQAEIQRAIQGEAIEESEYRILKKTGEVRWIQVARHLVWDETHQRVIRIHNIARDITDRKQTELALRASEERYRIISELISDYAFSAAVRPDGELELEWVSGAFQRITGYPNEAILDKRIPLLHPEDSERVQAEIMRAKAGTSIDRSEYRVITQDGSVRWVQVTRQPVWDARQNRVVRLYNVAKDITDRKEVELALRRSEERFRLVARVVSDGVYDWDMVRNTSWHNEGYQETFGTGNLNVSEVAAWFERIYPDDRVSVVESQMHAVYHEDHWAAEYRMRRSNGTYATVLDRANIMRDQYGNPTRLIGAVSDITAHRASEKQALDLALQKEKVQILTDFVTAISHDFRTPLSVITTSLYLLEKSPHPEDWQRHVRKLQEQAEHIEQLVDGLLIMTRLDRENVLVFESIDLKDVVVIIEARMRPLCDQKNLTLLLEHASEPLPISGDRQW
ncbi:MAG: PAS domain S-box protein, partial [Anaerolineae bacterium]|nr:PAS domain S-box protein [Anaerolineae bacterium]